jgi:hypothetical protein
VIVFYISGHGFGHASRDIEVINALLDRRPGVPIVIRTATERWLFDLTLRHRVEIEHAETDTGIVQIDSLRLDARASVRRAAAFYRTFGERAEQEARRLRELGARMVVSDIPPLAFRAAATAGIPAVALGNFTWDWIYAGYPDLLHEAPGLVDTIREAYESAVLAIRLPMHGGFESIGTVRDVPFVARRSTRDPEDVRKGLGLDHARRVALLSFGGHGLQGLDLAGVDATGDYAVVTTGHIGDQASGLRLQAPAGGRSLEPGAARRASGANPVCLDERGLYDAGLRYEDLVAAADVVVTKPGYGIIAECLANATALLYTARGRFIEYDVLVDAMPRFLRARFISRADLYEGRWRAHLDALLAQPPPPEQPATNGAEVAAGMILDMIDRT